MMRRLVLGMALASTALATPAMARDKSWYVEGDAGGVIVENQNFKVHSTDATFGTFATKVGYDFGGVVGYDFGMFRLETEASYRRAEEKKFTSAAGTIFDKNVAHQLGGGSEALSFMANASKVPVGGLVLGMSKTVVTPPLAAAPDPVCHVSLWG